MEDEESEQYSQEELEQLALIIRQCRAVLDFLHYLEQQG